MTSPAEREIEPVVGIPLVELLDGQTVFAPADSIDEALAYWRCPRPEQCRREFDEYGVTKFYTDSEAGIPINPIVMRRVQ